MSKKANPTVIGVFIVAGLALGVAGLIIFSSGNLFSKKERYILYFESSMKGMNVGAPVQYRGVTIGSVVEIYVAHNQSPDDFSMPLVVELDETLLREKTDRGIASMRDKLKEMVARGLRARMDAANLITGVLQVQLELMPDAPPPVYHQIGNEFPEIPTAPTTIEMLLANLAKVDISGFTKKLDSILTRLDSTLGGLDVKSINAGVTNLLTSANLVVGSPELTNSFTSLRRALDDFSTLARNIDTNTLAQIDATLTELRTTTLADLRTTTQRLSGILAPDSPMQTELIGALEQLNNAARSIAELTEFLKRNPNALITGRTPPKEKP